MALTASPQDSLEPRSYGMTPPASLRLIRALDAHVAAEADDIARCERIAETHPTDAPRLVLDLIVASGHRQQALLESMIERLREDSDCSEPSVGAGLPVPDAAAFAEFSEEGAAAELRSLLRDKQEGARYLRHLARQQASLHFGFLSLLLEAVARENETHVHLLRFLLRRVNAG
jgi:hypothetical protein